MEIVRDVFHADGEDLEGDSDLRDLPNWDSLNHMNFIATLENEYGVVLSGDEIAEMLSLEVINRVLRERHGLRL